MMDKVETKKMLADKIDNIKAPEGFRDHADFKRTWLHAVADCASDLAKDASVQG